MSVSAVMLPIPALTATDLSCNALFFDIDGTLLDFAARPDAVLVPTKLQRDLVAIHAGSDGAVALLSGRSLDDIDRLLAWRDKAAAGLHGGMVRFPDGHVQSPAHDEAFEQVRQQALLMASDVPEVLVEPKPMALALHYRHDPRCRHIVEAMADRLLLMAGRRYTLLHGNHVIEIKPAAANKGKALETLMAQPPFAGRRPWMLGDDFTDEDAFEAANAVGGVSIIIGQRRPTAARHALPDPAAVRAFVHALANRRDTRSKEQA